MMQGYLIYKPEEAKKNHAFIELFYEAGKKYNIKISYISYDTYQSRPLPDFVLNRTRDSRVSFWFEKHGIPVFHQKEVVTLGNDKWKMLAFLSWNIRQNIQYQDKIILPQSILKSAGQMKQYVTHKNMLINEIREAYIKDTLSEKKEFQAKDFVIKTVDGHGGNEVFLLSDFWENRQVLENHDCVIQERIDSEAKDLRVYILGGEIYQPILRQGAKDFRSNYSLGGQAASYTLSVSEREQMEAVLACFRENQMHLSMAGLDFIIRRDGTLVFNELEEMVGCRMLYANTNKNIVLDFMEYIWKFLDRRMEK